MKSWRKGFMRCRILEGPWGSHHDEASASKCDTSSGETVVNDGSDAEPGLEVELGFEEKHRTPEELRCSIRRLCRTCVLLAYRYAPAPVPVLTEAAVVPWSRLSSCGAGATLDRSDISNGGDDVRSMGGGYMGVMQSNRSRMPRAAGLECDGRGSIRPTGDPVLYLANLSRLGWVKLLGG